MEACAVGLIVTEAACLSRAEGQGGKKIVKKIQPSKHLIAILLEYVEQTKTQMDAVYYTVTTQVLLAFS